MGVPEFTRRELVFSFDFYVFLVEKKENEFFFFKENIKTDQIHVANQHLGLK